MAETKTTKIGYEEFIKRAIDKLLPEAQAKAKAGGKPMPLGLHTRFSSLTGAIEAYYGDSIKGIKVARSYKKDGVMINNVFTGGVAVVLKLADEGKIGCRPVKGGFMVYREKTTGSKTGNNGTQVKAVLDKILA